MRKWLLILPVVLAGCSVQTRAIRQNYADFNETIHYNQSQQMLLNLVRLKYRETPFFMKVGALSSSYDFTADGSLGVGRLGSADVWDVGVGGSVSARPTITYTPLEGNTFVKQVLSEVEHDTFVLLLRAGWPISMLSHIIVESIGENFNNEDDPSYGRFNELAGALQEAQESRNLQVDVRDDEIFLKIKTDRVDVYDPSRRGDPVDHEVPMAAFQLRSFLDIMFFLAKNTQIPEAHADQVKSGRVNGWMDIRVTKDRPGDAMVSVQHGGYYYSVAKSDIRSKDTFALLKILYQMQAGDIKGVEPILTLPIAQP